VYPLRPGGATFVDAEPVKLFSFLWRELSVGENVIQDGCQRNGSLSMNCSKIALRAVRTLMARDAAYTNAAINIRPAAASMNTGFSNVSSKSVVAKNHPIVPKRNAKVKGES
jgi:hypothetical protein